MMPQLLKFCWTGNYQICFVSVGNDALASSELVLVQNQYVNADNQLYNQP